MWTCSRCAYGWCNKKEAQFTIHIVQTVGNSNGPHRTRICNDVYVLRACPACVHVCRVCEDKGSSWQHRRLCCSAHSLQGIHIYLQVPRCPAAKSTSALPFKLAAVALAQLPQTRPQTPSRLPWLSSVSTGAHASHCQLCVCNQQQGRASASPPARPRGVATPVPLPASCLYTHSGEDTQLHSGVCRQLAADHTFLFIHAPGCGVTWSLTFRATRRPLPCWACRC